MDIELRHARTVVAIDTAGSISRGAIALNLPQPSLTAQLRRIEKAVGGALFVRSHSGVTPTGLGQRLIPMLADLVRRADEVIAEAAAATSATLRFGNTEWTPPTLRGALQASLPSVEVQTETLGPAAAVDALQRGNLTAALISGLRAELDEPSLGRAVIVREPVWLALAHDHPLAGRDRVGVRDLGELSWVHYSKDHWFQAVEKRLFAMLDHRPLDVLHHVDGHREAMSWVRDMGVAALTTPSGVTPDVRLVPVDWSESVDLLLVWRGGTVAGGTLRKLVEAVRQYYCEYARTVPLYWPWITAHPQDFTELGLPRRVPVSS
ncbi:LysR family transcriptional regulator [Streptomyces sp. NPDC091272]|uniref:LysR family transcriptional regulator n=1 Tax=Streptomyces sp. NPDC091272 TaxID=3365981 RepID=UPI0037F1C9B0